MANLDDVLSAIYQNDRGRLEKLNSSEVNTTDLDGRSPLMHAVLAERADPLTVKILIERGSDVNARDNDRQWTALHFAAQDHKAEIVQILLDNNAAVDPVDRLGNSPLWQAVMTASSDLNVVRQLIKSGADPTRKNDYNVSPVDIAEQSRRSDILSVLKRKPTR